MVRAGTEEVYKSKWFAYDSLHFILPHLQSKESQINLLKRHQSQRSLRSGSELLLDIPRVRTRFGERRFSRAGPHVSNSLPTEVRTRLTKLSFTEGCMSVLAL